MVINNDLKADKEYGKIIFKPIKIQGEAEEGKS
jgi:hypothetical protein